MITHHTVYRKEGRFAGWPANYGMWHWGDELVLVFTEGAFKATPNGHARDKAQPFKTLQARSLDGGITWNVSDFPGKSFGCPISADEHVISDLSLEKYLDHHPDALLPPPGKIDFSHPDFAMLCGRSGLDADTVSFFYFSIDRCHSWQGPYSLPMFGQTAVAARTSYQAESADSCLLFLTANKTDGDEGRVFCTRTTDGGKTFDFVSFIGEEPAGSGFAIMPSHLSLGDGHYLCAIRCRSEDNHGWIDLYASHDCGVSWQFLNRPVTFRQPGNSNPPSLVQLPHGRIALVYGNRDLPCSVCAVFSEDEGQSWSEPVVLRQTSGSSDMGYTRAVVLDDGTVITAYYLNEDNAGERFIEVTRWKP